MHEDTKLFLFCLAVAAGLAGVIYLVGIDNVMTAFDTAAQVCWEERPLCY